MQTSTPASRSDSLSASLERAVRPPLIVFSHLRWGFVHQRPQHLLTRLAQHFDVYFIEEPVFADAEPALMSATHQNGVEVLTPRTKEFASGFHDSQLNAMRPLIADFMASRGLREPLVWLTTPMALPLVADLEPRAVVHDCMEDLASRKFAPPELAAREQELMALADVVLAGGPSLYEARQGRHPEDDANVKAQTPITVTTVDQSALTDYIDLNATSVFQQKNYIKSNANGYIQKANALPGHFVNKGEVLFTVKTKEAQAIGNSINVLDTTLKFSGVNKIKSPGPGYVSQLNHQAGDYCGNPAAPHPRPRHPPTSAQ